MSEEETSEERLGMEHVAAALRSARKSRKLKISGIVDSIKIKEEFLEAMEAGNFEKLPSGIYRRAYLKTYAEFLGLDATSLLKELDGAADAIKEQEEAVRLAPEPYRTTLKPNRLLVIGSLVAAAAAYFIWQQDIIQPRVPIASHEQVVVQAYSNPTPVITVVAVAPVQLIILDAQGKALQEGSLQAGDTYFAPEEGQFIARAQPESGIEVYVDGNLVTGLENLEHQQGGVPLDRAKLLAHTVIP